MKKVALFVIYILLNFNALAQNGVKLKERMEAQRAAFITQRLNLTPEEAQQFWPIYNQLTEKLQQIRNADKDEKKPLDEMTDAEAEKTIAASFDKESRELELKKEYFQRLKKVISIKKIAKLYRVEREFKGELVKRLNEFREAKKQMKQDRN